MIALLGAHDEPTDGVRDYCACLKSALAAVGVNLKLHDVRWKEDGWSSSLRKLRSDSLRWRGQWVFVQYTHFAWSRRGFPFGLVRVLHILRRSRAQLAIVFHEPFPALSHRLQDRLRAQCQIRVMKKAFVIAMKSVFAFVPENIDWLPAKTVNAIFISIGANFSPPVEVRDRSLLPRVPRVGVFCITGGSAQEREVEDITHAVQIARERVGPLTLCLFGRGVEEARGKIQQALGIPGVQLEMSGVIPDTKLAEITASCDVMLCVRGELSPKRGSALAAVACGVPIVGYRGPDTQFPITEIGAEFAPSRDRGALADALCRVLTDGTLRHDLQARNARAYSIFFSWNSIAERYLKAFPE